MKLLIPVSPEWQALASKEAHVLKDPPEHSAFCCSCSLLSLSPTSPISSLEATTSLWQRLAQVCAECFSRILPVGISSGDKCWVGFVLARNVFGHTQVTESSISKTIVVHPIVFLTPISERFSPMDPNIRAGNVHFLEG